MLAVECPALEKRSPFIGEVAIRGVYLPTRDGMYKQERLGARGFTCLRAQLAKNQHLVPASIVHAAEMQNERSSMNPLWCALSMLYDWLSG